MIRVLRPGLQTSVQDQGRHGLQHIGLCPGGAMDPVALALANALVGNPVNDAALEITVIGPELEFESETLVAVCGAEFQGTFPHIAPVLGSRSTYLPGTFGGFKGRALRHGDALPLKAQSLELSRERFGRLKRRRERTVPWSVPPHTLPDREPILVHVMEGQHFADFDADMQRTFFDAVWRIASDSNRMGFRLAGPRLARGPSDEILSGPTCLGTVQVPASGAPIALMADHQTTGGYPKIAEIASADVLRLAQLAPGGQVHFAKCTLEMAAELRRDTKERLQAALRGIAWEYGS